MKIYSFPRGMTIRKYRVPVGAFYAMGETHVEEANVFDVYRDEAFICREETYEGALFTALLYAKTIKTMNKRQNTNDPTAFIPPACAGLATRDETCFSGMYNRLLDDGWPMELAWREALQRINILEQLGNDNTNKD